MPLVGTVCCRDGQEHSFEDCLASSRAGLCKHPAPLLGSMAKNSEGRKDAGISFSVLSGCPRQHYLGAEGFYEDPDKYYARWLGTIGHAIIEGGGPYPGITQEERLYRDIEVDGVTFTLSGMPDWIDRDGGRIDDFKFVAFAPRQPYESHEAQVNFYGWLDPGFNHTHSAIHYFHGPSGPDRKRYSRFEVGVWTEQAIESWVRRKLSPHAAYARGAVLSGEATASPLAGDFSALLAPPDFAWQKACPFQRTGQCCGCDNSEIQVAV